MYWGISLKNSNPRSTLQQPYAQGPVVVLGGLVFFMSEVALNAMSSKTSPHTLPGSYGQGRF